MEFEIKFYKDESGKSPVEEFLLGLVKKNKTLLARTRQGIEKLRNKAYHREPLSKRVERGLW